MNYVFLIGRITKDLTLASNGKTDICRFSLAVSRRLKDKDDTDFINIVTFGSIAQTVSKYCKKGSLIAIKGNIKTGSYTKQDGTKAYTTDVIAENIQFLDTKPKANNNSVNQNGSVYMDDLDVSEELPF